MSMLAAKTKPFGVAKADTGPVVHCWFYIRSTSSTLFFIVHLVKLGVEDGEQDKDVWFAWSLIEPENIWL